MQAAETFQYRLFYMNEKRHLTVDESAGFERMLLLHIILQAVDDALNGDAISMLWVLSTGAGLLEDLGWAAIDLSQPEQINVELIDRTLGNEPVRRCRDCAHCFQDGESATCLLGVWERLGLQPEYGVQTVDKGARGRIHACGLWTSKSKE